MRGLLFLAVLVAGCGNPLPAPTTYASKPTLPAATVPKLPPLPVPDPPPATKPVPTRPAPVPEVPAVQPAPKKAELRPEHTVTDVDFFDEYVSNPIAADLKYAGKRVCVSGNVWKAAREDNGRYSVGLIVAVFPGLNARQLESLSPRERKWFNEGSYPPSVVGHLNPEGVKQAAKLKPGGIVYLTGKVIGPKKTEAWRDVVVELTDCTVEKSGPK